MKQILYLLCFWALRIKLLKRKWEQMNDIKENRWLNLGPMKRPWNRHKLHWTGYRHRGMVTSHEDSPLRRYDQWMRWPKEQDTGELREDIRGKTRSGDGRSRVPITPVLGYPGGRAPHFPHSHLFFLFITWHNGSCLQEHSYVSSPLTSSISQVRRACSYHRWDIFSHVLVSRATDSARLLLLLLFWLHFFFF